MNVSDAIAARRSVRGFLDTPVDPAVLRDIVVQAARAASGGNLQPWHIDLVSGDSLAELKAIVAAKLAAGHSEEPGYDIYPRELIAPYRDRRFAVGEAMYAHIGIPREDKAARRQWFARNFQFFGAPAALFCTVDRRMGPPQWSDLGMYLQNVMLLRSRRGWRRVRRNAGRCTPRRSRRSWARPPTACSFAAWRSAMRTWPSPPTGCAPNAHRKASG